MPKIQGYKQPTKTSAKAKSSMMKALKAQDSFTLTHIKELIKDAYNLNYPYCGMPDDYKDLVNKPENFDMMSDKAAHTLAAKVEDILSELLLTFPEYTEEESRKKYRDESRKDCVNLSSTHYQYNHARYQFDSNEYEVDKNKKGFEACVNKIFYKYDDRSKEWYDNLYTHLRDSNNFTLELDAEESISISMHISSWSYWSVLKTSLNGEEISSGNCSYKDSEHNRL